jgi:hypothetical protein
MDDTLWKYLFINWPGVAFASFAVVGAVILTWRAVRKYFYWTSKIESNSEECKKISLEIIPQLYELNSRFNSLLFYLGASDEKFNAGLFISRSPLRLSDTAIKILEETGGKRFIDQNEAELIAEMDKIAPKTALDCQVNAPSAIAMVSGKESFNCIKDYIYDHPSYEVVEKGKNKTFPLSLMIVQNIMGIYLRDRYLGQTSGIEPA